MMQPSEFAFGKHHVHIQGSVRMKLLDNARVTVSAGDMQAFLSGVTGRVGLIMSLAPNGGHV